MIIRNLLIAAVIVCSQLANALHDFVPTHYVQPGVQPPQIDRQVTDFGLDIYYYLPFGEFRFAFCAEAYCNPIASQLELSRSIIDSNSNVGFSVLGLPFGGQKDFGLLPDDIQLLGGSLLFDSSDSQIVFSDGIFLSELELLTPLRSGGTSGTAFNFDLDSELSIFLTNSIIELFNSNPVQINGRDHYLRQVYDGPNKRTDLYVYDTWTRENILIASNVPIPAAAWLFISAFGFLIGTKIRLACKSNL